MAAVHAWEADGYSEGEEERTNQPPRHKCRRVWEMGSDSGSDEDEPAPDLGYGSETDSDDEDPDPLTDTDAAAEMFLDTLLGLYVQSFISAQTFCVICFWAGLSGVQNRKVRAYGRPPGADSGNYQKRLDRRLGYSKLKKECYELNVVGQRKHDVGRTGFRLPVKQLHEEADRISKKDGTLATRLQEALDDKSLPPTYYNNPIVIGNPDELVMPWGLYLDGVPYNQTDSVVAVWLFNLISGARSCIALVRKRIVCRCGCRGWCTYFPLLSHLRACMRKLAEGVYESVRHDGQDWREGSDAHRRLNAGKRLLFRGVVLFLKGDWAEFCERLGFPTWQSVSRPCFCCASFGAALFNAVGVSMAGGGPWHENTDDDFEAACQRCEILFTVACGATHTAIKRALGYDNRKDGSCGRALKWDVAGTVLQQDDRLEPTDEMPDVQDFDSINEYPFNVIFWRVSLQTICLKRCPLWDPELGFTPTRVICIDALHSLYLGTMLNYCKHVIWFMLQAGVWGDCGTIAHYRVAVEVLRTELLSWYKTPKGEGLTHVHDVAHKMLGEAGKQKLKTKAMETWGLLLFLCDMLLSYRLRLGPMGQRLREAGLLLQHYVELIKCSGYNMAPSTLQDQMK